MDRVQAFLTLSSGSGDGYGYGFGSGDGYGDGDGIASIKGNPVYDIDGIPTLLYQVKGNLAKGAILQADLTLKPCYIARSGDFFAHGDTAEQAIEDARAKKLEERPVEDRIAEFWTCHEPGGSYAGHDLYKWHGVLTGSCRTGRDAFVASKGIDLDKPLSIPQFIELCKNAYGSEVIELLATTPKGDGGAQ